MKTQELWVDRKNLRKAKLVERDAALLVEGDVRLAIDKFALTANNITYALSGEMLGYWRYYPAEAEWGIVPVWGFADVVESRCPEIAVGERIWGFLPMASEVVLTPGKLGPGQFFDFAPHRKGLPSLYNLYYRTANDPPQLKALEDERCLMFPLFATSFILYDYLLAHDWFGAEQILIGSASSKTGFGLAWLLNEHKGSRPRVIGMTSPSNRAFVEGLQICDDVISYADIGRLEAGKPLAFVDMAGSGPVIAAVHAHFGDNVKESCIVGATHWDAERKGGELKGAKPTMFFAPNHIAQREKEWGAGSVLPKTFAASTRIAASVAGQINVVHLNGGDAVLENYLAMLDNQVPPSRGLMLSLRR